MVDNWESLAKQEPCYHGYLPREDLIYVLDRHGDYVLRATEIVEKSLESRTKELVLAILVDPEQKTIRSCDTDNKEGMIKNVIVTRFGGYFAIEVGQRFETLSTLLHHYMTTPIRMNNVQVKIVRGVPLSRWEFRHKEVEKGKALGAGAFGEVHKGSLRKRNGKIVPVAIKSLKNAAVCREQINEMMREARLMRNLKHPNVVRIYGVALCEQPLFILLELVCGGSLDDYLKQQAVTLDRDEKLQMVMGAVWGLEYLHGQRILHRDIASRNCLYDENKNVKISDFGLSRNGTIYRMKIAKKMPIKWMAPESISEFIFSQKTDVYSLGVLIYEIFACKESYDGLSNAESRQRIIEGTFNEFPEKTPNKLQVYVKEKMWKRDPTLRSNMQHIRQWMEAYTGLERVKEEDDSKKTARRKLRKERAAPRN